jgi:hypothetical protein
MDYKVQSLVHGDDPETVRTYLWRLASRIRFYRFFFLAPLYLALPIFLFSLREWRFRWVLLTLALFALGTNSYPYFYPHYLAALVSLFVLVSVTALERLGRLSIRGRAAGQDAVRLILFLCAAHFIFWYGLRAFQNEEFSMAMLPYESWDLINYGDPQRRIAINHQLAQVPGKQLVFVRYWPQHMFEEWVHNSADVDGARIVWARDLGQTENEKLLRYYPDRKVWLLEPDAKPPKLRPYQPEPVVHLETAP